MRLGGISELCSETTDEAVTYLAGSGIGEEVCREYRITTQTKNKHILVFPFYDETGKLQFVKYRNTQFRIGIDKNKEWCERDTMPILFGMDHCKNFDRLIITEELSRLYWLNREIEREKRRLKELADAAESATSSITGLPHVTGRARKSEGVAILIAEQRDLVELKVKQSVIEYNRLNRLIASVDDPMIREILTLRFVNGLSWRQVASRMGGNNSADGARMACQRYLDSH